MNNASDCIRYLLNQLDKSYENGSLLNQEDAHNQHFSSLLTGLFEDGIIVMQQRGQKQ